MEVIETRKFTTAAREFHPWLASLERPERDAVHKALLMFTRTACAFPMPMGDEDSFAVIEADQALRQEGWDACLAWLMNAADELAGV